MGDEKYPKTMVAAKTLLEDWQVGASKQKSHETGIVKEEEGVAFVKEARKKRNHISTLTSYAMVAGERSITFLIAPQLQRQRRRKS